VTIEVAILKTLQLAAPYPARTQLINGHVKASVLPAPGVGEISDKLATMTQRHFIVRVPDPLDDRVEQYALTDAGRAYLFASPYRDQ
jgi:hypothetical protein